ncbi:MAG: acyl-CoA thioesterase [Christensenellales bacterium]|jgi:acyl-CoA thioester hydrolase
MELHPYIRRVQFYETDQMGVIHHANYIRWFEEARVDFTEQLGYGYRHVEEQGISFAVLGVCCDYHSIVRFGESVAIWCSMPAFSATRMTIAYRITDAESGQLRASGETRHCYLNRENRPVSLKRAIPELYELFMGLVAKPESNP